VNAGNKLRIGFIPLADATARLVAVGRGSIAKVGLIAAHLDSWKSVGNELARTQPISCALHNKFAGISLFAASRVTGPIAFFFADSFPARCSETIFRPVLHLARSL
jgi:hypothetical protein